MSKKNKNVNIMDEKDKTNCEKNNCMKDSNCESKECQENSNCENKDCKETTCCEGKECQENSDREDKHECRCEQDQQKIEMLNNKVSELQDLLLRSQAETINYKRRKDEETLRTLKYANEEILKGFLPILDNFERAIYMEDDNNFGDETSKFLEGFRIVYKQTKDLLEKFEVKEIECLDKEFDPAVSQAISTEKNPEKPSGIILKVYQKGYMYKDKVLRSAMVIVNE